MSTQNENYSTGDINKTNIIQRLVEIPKEKRDGKWEKLFLENIANASLCCHDTKIITGGDGFPYLQLFLPEFNKSFQSYVIENMLELLLEQGVGIAFNPNASTMSVDWVFTCGAILNYYLNKVFYSQGEDVTKGEENIKEDEKVLLISPSENILPKQTRALISKFLKNTGIEQPKILMVDNDNTSQVKLFFNITPDKFENKEQFNYVLNGVSWYLPNNYLFSGVNTKDFNIEFEDL